MGAQFNELNKNKNATWSGGRLSRKGVRSQNRSAGISGASVLFAVLIGAGGCRSVNDTSEKDDSEVQAYSASLHDRDMTGGDLVKEALGQLEAGQNEKAIVALYLFLDAVEPGEGRLVGLYQDVRFKLASLLISENRMSEASAVLEDYLDSPLAERESEAREMLNTCTSEIRGTL